MIAPVSNNALLAALFGSNPTQRMRGLKPAWQSPSEPASVERAEGPYRQPADTVELSTSARVHAHSDGTAPAEPGAPAAATREVDREQSGRLNSGDALRGAEGLTEQERAEVSELRERDREVRRHEQAHQAAAGPHAHGGPTYKYETGPDGKRYAVEGEVQIDPSEVSGDPEATIAKMQQVRRAALAPGNPSSQDRTVAAKAAATEQKARAEMGKQHAIGGSEQAAGALLDLVI